MEDKKNTISLTGILEKLLGEGIVIQGDVKIENLTLTSVEKAKDMGLLEVTEEEYQEEDEYPQAQEEQHDVLNNEVVSRDEFNRMVEEISSLRNMVLSGSQAKQSLTGQRGRRSKQSKRD